MEEDIVARLRRFASGLAGAGLGSPGPLMSEAADEIERLRTELANAEIHRQRALHPEQFNAFGELLGAGINQRSRSYMRWIADGTPEGKIEWFKP